MPASFPLADLIFVGLRGYVIAVHRDTGETVWTNNQLKSGYTTLLLDGDRLVVSTNGYLYCLEPLTGRIAWQNPLKGFGVGVTSLASRRGTGTPIEAFAAAEEDERRRSNDSSSASSAS